MMKLMEVKMIDAFEEVNKQMFFAIFSLKYYFWKSKDADEGKKQVNEIDGSARILK